MRVKLKDVADRIKGNEDRLVTKLPYYLGGEHYESGAIAIYDKGLIHSDEGRKLGFKFHFPFQKGDTIFMARNPHLKKAGMVMYDGICSDASYILRTKDESVLLGRYLPLVMQDDRTWRFFEREKSGSTNFLMNWKELKEYEFELPDIETQCKIADLAWAMEETKQAYRRLLEKTDELVEARFVDMFGNPATNSKGLKQLPLKDCLNGIENGTSFVCSNDARTGNHPAVLKLSAATYGIYKPEENKAVLHEDDFITDAEVHDGDLLFTRKNTPELVGISAYVRHTPPKLMLPDIIFRLKTKESCNKIFLWKLLNHYLFRNTIRNLANGSANSMVNISKERLGSMPIILPPIDQQKDFERFVDQAAASKSALQHAIAALQKTYRKLVSERLG